MHVNKKYSEVKSLTGLQIIDTYNLYSAGDSNLEFKPFSKGDSFINLKEFLAFPVTFVEALVGVHCVRRLIYSENVYSAGDRFYFRGHRYVLAKIGENKLSMVNISTGATIPLVRGITKENTLQESGLREMFQAGDFSYINPALSE